MVSYLTRSIRWAQDTVPGLCHFKVLCFGLINAPATSQDVMNCISAGKAHIVVHLEDILVFGRNAEEHEQHLHDVLSLLHENGLIVKLLKMQVNRPEVKYLDHIVSRAGIQPDTQKIAAVADWPVPKDMHELHCFHLQTSSLRWWQMPARQA